MSGMCYSCASHFGLFNKELGCKNCGFAFCKKCLTKKTPVPKLNNKNAAVCVKCFNILTGKTAPQGSAASFEPPDAFIKRLAALEEGKTNTAHSASSSNQSVSKQQPSKHQSVGKEDAAIAERLDRLKDGQGAAVPSQSEIEARLAKLKEDERRVHISSETELSNRLAKFRGQNVSTTNQSSMPAVVRRSEQEQIDSLIEEASDEAMLDSRMNTVSDIQDRLDRLKSSTVQNNFDEIVTEPGREENKPTNVLNIPVAEPTSGSEEPNLSEVDKLMRDAAAEAQLDASRAIEEMKKDEELWNRVQLLKDSRQAKRVGNENSDSGDSVSLSSNEDCSKAGQLVKQILEESKLDEKLNSGDISVPSRSVGVSCPKSTTANDSGDDDLPWCCICNNDAALRCAGCDGDLYCQRCYREGHDRFEMTDHKTTPFSPAVRRLK